MTVQQKIIAKNSKKAFTLVELVVVIAILAVLASVAVIMITGYISSATTAAGESNAQLLNEACQIFISGIITGTINAETYNEATDGEYAEEAVIPSKGASTQDIYEYLNFTATLYHAASYSGLADLLEGDAYYAGDTEDVDYLYDYVAINYGTSSAQIVYAASYSDSEVKIYTISKTTKLASLYGEFTLGRLYGNGS